MDEIDAPDVVRTSQSQADGRAVLVIKPFTSLVAMRQLKPFFPPQALDLLVIDDPAFHAKELSNPTIGLAAIQLSQPDQSQT